MNKVKVPSGTSQKLETVFNDLTSYEKLNLKNRINKVFSVSGIFTTYNSETGTIGTELKINVIADVDNKQSFTLSAGEAYTKEGELIKVSTLQTLDLNTVFDGTLGALTYYLIKIKYKEQGSSPIAAQNAFVYDTTGTIDYSTKYSRYTDSYEISAVEITDGAEYASTLSDDELALAIVKTNNLSTPSLYNSTGWTFDGISDTSGSYDVRHLSVLSIDPKIYKDTDIVRKDRDSVDGEKINGSLEVSNLLKGKEVEVNNSSGNALVTLKTTDSEYTFTVKPSADGGALEISPDSNGYPLIVKDKSGTTLAYFDTDSGKIGVKTIPSTYTVEVDGTLNVTGIIKSQDKFVMTSTTLGDVPLPKNLRISDIAVHSTHAQARASGTIAPETFVGGESGIPLHTIIVPEVGSTGQNKLDVKFNWCWEDISAVMDTATSVRITESGLTFTEDELVDYKFSIKYTSTSYEGVTLYKTFNINDSAATSGGVTVLTLEDLSFSLTGVTIQEVTIHTGADQYDLVFVPELASGQRVETSIVYRDWYGVSIKANIPLEAGSVYYVYIRAKKYEHYSGYHLMVPGTFDTFDYGQPFVVLHPYISSVGSSLTTTATSSGFRVSIAGWADAQTYEIGYTIDSDGVDFSDPSSQYSRLITSTKIRDIATSFSGNFHVGVRPLIAGQAVAEPKYSTVLSGSSGIPPNAIPIVQQYVNLATFSGIGNSVEDVGAVTGTLTVESGIKSPGESSTTYGNTLPQILEGRTINISWGGDYFDYIIDEVKANGTELVLIPIGSSPAVPTSTDSPFTINSANIRARRIVKKNDLPTNFQLVKMTFDCDIHKGDDVTLRAYQIGRSSEADQLTGINTSEYGYSQDCNAVISLGNGDRTLIIDAWDETDGATNTGIIKGLLTVYAIPRYYTGPPATTVNPTIIAS